MEKFIADTPEDPKDQKCDFCSAPVLNACWSYPCRDHSHTETAATLFESGRLKTMSIEGNSIGEWAACAPCHALIERGDYVKLARRSAKRMLRYVCTPEMAAAWSLKDATEYCRRVHDDFRKNREGPPTRER